MAYEFMRHGIKGGDKPWERINKFIAMGVIDKMINSGMDRIINFQISG